MNKGGERILQAAVTLALVAGIVWAGKSLLASHKSQAAPAAPTDKALTATVQQVEAGGAWLIGSGKTPYTLVEFIDFQCPPCRQQSPSVVQFVQTHSDKLSMLIHNFPLQMHPYARSLAEYAVAAESLGRFPQFYEAVLRSDFNFTKADVEKCAKRAGLPWDKFHSAAASKASAAKVDVDLALAKQLKLPGTPSFVLIGPNGKCTLLGSPQSLRKAVGSL